MLAIMIERAKKSDQIAGVVPRLVDGGLSILQYAADDIILFMEHDIEKAKNQKLILSAFEQISGLKETSIRVRYFASEKNTSPSCFVYQIIRVWASSISYVLCGDTDTLL